MKVENNNTQAYAWTSYHETVFYSCFVGYSVLVVVRNAKHIATFYNIYHYLALTMLILLKTVYGFD